jgi:hypothetical protein
MSFPWDDYAKVTNEASEIIADRDGKGRNAARGFYEGFPHGHQDISFELARRVGRILGAELGNKTDVMRADAVDLINYAKFYVMLLDKEASAGAHPAPPQPASIPLPKPRLVPL